MTQSVNFLKDIPKISPRLSLSRMSFIICIAVLLLTSISVLQYWQQSKVQLELDAANAKLVNAQQTYDQLLQAHPLLVGDIPLTERVKTLQQQYQDKKNQYGAFEQVVAQRGFSHYLLGLARSVPNSLWLDHIKVDDAQANVFVQGFAVRPDDVSTFLRHLKRDPAYAKIFFNLFSLKTVTDKNYVKFSVATQDQVHDEGSLQPTPTESKEKST